MIATKSQIISKKRVIDHGEVFTAEREVNAMLGLVSDEVERIESRFLEPACGTGNFLVPILQKKIEVIRRRYAKSQMEFERYTAVTVGSIYGIDILPDSIDVCRGRLFDTINDIYRSLYRKKTNDKFLAATKFILERNVLLGDALSLKTVDKKPKPIVFSEWSLVRGGMMKRRDFIFEELIPRDRAVIGLFDDCQVSDTGTPVFLPKPIKEYPLAHLFDLPSFYER